MVVKTEYKGANIEEAINKACTSLELAREDLDIEVVSAGSAGIFGLLKRKAVISAAPKNGHKIATDTTSTTRPQSHANADATAKKPAMRQQKRDNSPRDSVSAPPPETISEIGSTLKEMLNLLDYKAEVNLELDDSNRIKAQISCADEAAIIGREGENIDAVQYLLRKIISHKYPQKIFFSIDVGNYRERRKKHLQDLALSVADKVKESGKNQIINALNPAERRIVHVTLQEDTTIRSVSMGDGLFKKIKIFVPGKNRKMPATRPRKNR
jgi:spoIIIJ-associated protein